MSLLHRSKTTSVTSHSSIALTPTVDTTNCTSASQKVPGRPTYIRQATIADVPVLYDHARNLALHHNALSLFSMTPANLHNALTSKICTALLAFSSTTSYAEAVDFTHREVGKRGNDKHDDDDDEPQVVIGSVIFTPTFSSWSGHENVFMEHLYVHPHGRGTGAGKRLVQAILARLRPGARVEFSVQRSNVSGLAFYDALEAQPHDGYIEMRIVKT